MKIAKAMSRKVKRRINKVLRMQCRQPTRYLRRMYFYAISKIAAVALALVGESTNE